VANNHGQRPPYRFRCAADSVRFSRSTYILSGSLTFAVKRITQMKKKRILWLSLIIGYWLKVNLSLERCRLRTLWAGNEAVCFAVFHLPSFLGCEAFAPQNSRLDFNSPNPIAIM